METDANVFAQDVALMACVYPNGVIHPPSKNDFSPHLRAQSAGWSLTFEEEVNLARTLAFLAGTTGNSKHVLAIAVEEVSDAEMKVVLAVNKARPDDSNKILKSVTEGLQSIFNILESVQRGNRKFSKLAPTATQFDSSECMSRR